MPNAEWRKKKKTNTAWLCEVSVPKAFMRVVSNFAKGLGRMQRAGAGWRRLPEEEDREGSGGGQALASPHWSIRAFLGPVFLEEKTQKVSYR